MSFKKIVINSESSGVITFTSLVVWRVEYIQKLTSAKNKMSDLEIVKAIAKGAVCRIDDIMIKGESDMKNRAFILNVKETQEFANKFYEIQKDELKVALDKSNFCEREIDVIEKLSVLWKAYIKKINKDFTRSLGFGSNFIKVLNENQKFGSFMQIKGMSNAIAGITRSSSMLKMNEQLRKKAFDMQSILNSNHKIKPLPGNLAADARLRESFEHLGNVQKKQAKREAETSAVINDLPRLINEMNSVFETQLQISNNLLGKQSVANENQSKRAKIFSIFSLIISLFALAGVAFFGIVNLRSNEKHSAMVESELKQQNKFLEKNLNQNKLMLNLIKKKTSIRVFKKR